MNERQVHPIAWKASEHEIERRSGGQQKVPRRKNEADREVRHIQESYEWLRAELRDTATADTNRRDCSASIFPPQEPSDQKSLIFIFDKSTNTGEI